MLRQYENSIDDKRQFTALVKDIFPEEAKNINLILMAYNMGIVQDIQKANLLNNTFAFRYVKQDSLCSMLIHLYRICTQQMMEIQRCSTLKMRQLHFHHLHMSRK